MPISPELRPGAAGGPLRILLIEDDPICSELLRAHLGATAALECVASLRDGLARLAQGTFDLVITDLGLPDSAGLATLDAVQAATDRLIIVLSGNAAAREAALARGAYEFVPKDSLEKGALQRLLRLAAMQASTLSALREPEARRKHEERLLRLEHAVTRCLAESGTVLEALQGVMEAMCQAEDWDCGRYFEVDESAGVARFRAAWSADNDMARRYIEAARTFVYRPNEGVVGEAWRTAQPVWVADLVQDPRTAHPAIARETGMRGALNIPVAFGNRVIGVISITSRSVREPDERLHQALRVVGSQIGQYLLRHEAEDMQRRFQILHLRLQEKIARFGQSALAKREAGELIQDAVQHVLEALDAHAAAYLEPGPQAGDLAVRALAGTAAGHASAIVNAPGNPVCQVLADGKRFASERSVLPFEWAQGHATALMPVPGEDNRVRGVLCALSAHNSVLGAEELNFLDAAASVLSTGLKRIDSETRLAYFAQFDSLTGLPNRALLSDRFSQMIVQAGRRGAPLGVLFIDLDEFKLVNDSLGHAAGDDLLRETARRLQATVRPGDTVARISGDEFAIILNDLARPDDAALVAQKIIEQLAAPFELLGQEAFVTASIGIAAFPADGDSAEALLGAADAAMYRAKQSGRNAYQFFTTDINQRTRARAQLGQELRRALERDEFTLLYQPKYELKGGTVCGAEALLRWQHPERGAVPPAEFVPVLEETGLIVAVGDWVLRRACADIKAWEAAGLCPVPIAVNLSARQFRQQDIDLRMGRLLAAASVDPQLIEFEITESQLMQDPDHAIRVMRTLRAAGIRVAVDDFGTGYSSLAYLTRFPLAALKIDRSFVADMLNDRSYSTIVRTIIEMAHTLGFTVIAEGVETEAQAVFLRRYGCEQAQGFLFARPMPAESFRPLLKPVRLTV